MPRDHGLRLPSRRTCRHSLCARSFSGSSRKPDYGEARLYDVARRACGRDTVVLDDGNELLLKAEMGAWP
jgi:hypothetical protein